MTPSWLGLSIGWRTGRLCKGVWTGWIDWMNYVNFTKANPALGSLETHAVLQTWGKVVRKHHVRKSPGVVTDLV